MENAPRARLTLNPDPATHHFNDPRADRQTQAGAPKSARGRSVSLREGPKNDILFFRRDANASVSHQEFQRHALIRRFHTADAKAHFAALGKLDGIPQQIY